MKFPKVLLNILATVVRVGKKIFNMLFQEESKELGKQEPVTQQSSAEDISNIVEVFAQYKGKVAEQANELENSFCEEIAAFSEDLRFAADFENPIFQKYPVSFNRFDRMLSKGKKRMRGVIADTASRQVSLDSQECFEIMRMFPGQKKEERMNTLLQTALQNGLQEATNQFEDFCNELLEEYEETISTAIEQASREAKEVSAQMAMLLEAEGKNQSTAALVTANAESVIQAARLAKETLCLEVE